MIGIVNYGMGNLRSVQSALEYLGAKVIIVSNLEDLDSVDKIMLPGVGAFEKCKENLDAHQFTQALHHHTIKLAKPTMGICLGMQIMATLGFEAGKWDGLDWFDASVIKLHPTKTNNKIPNIGWEETNINKNCPLFKGLPKNPVFYFVHSYYMSCKDESNIVATYDFTFPVTAAVCKNNVFATQFHPEKSQDVGLQVLENFINWKP